jgi:hypothetical protein
MNRLSPAGGRRSVNISVEMPEVLACSASNCAYNRDDSCHAKAITIGDGIHPSCDTFIDDSSGQTHADLTAGVGACKVTLCSFNTDFECGADHIEVAIADHTANCMTYQV